MHCHSVRSIWAYKACNTTLGGLGACPPRKITLNPRAILVIDHHPLMLLWTQVYTRAGQYDGIIVIPRYGNSPILIPKLFCAIRFYRDRYYSDITIAEMSQKIMWR